jgi:hypothetical protein
MAETYQSHGMSPPRWTACEAYVEATKHFDSVLAETYRGFEQAIQKAYPKPDPVADAVVRLVQRSDALSDRCAALEQLEEINTAAALAALAEENQP